MQHRGTTADPPDMRSLAAWLLLIASVGLGVSFAGVRASVISTAVSICVLSMVWAWGGGRGCQVAFAVAIAGLGFVRGATVELRPTIRADQRGLAPTTRVLRVSAASVPGPQCRVSTTTERGVPVELLAPASACPRSWGDSIRVLSTEFNTDVVRQTPKLHTRVSVSKVWVVPASARTGWGAFRARVSRVVADIRQVGWDAARGDPSRGFVVASSLGLSSALPPDVRADVRRSGLGHLVAISGLHVGLAALGWLTALRWALARWSWGSAAAYGGAALPVVAYVVLTGSAAPAVRAATMFGLVSTGAVMGRPAHGPTVLAIAAAGMLFVQPNWILQPGFQLSVVAMLVLVGLPKASGPTFTSWHLGWALLPLLWFHFDAQSDGSVVANVVAIPVFALWVVPTAVLGWVLLPFIGATALDPAACGAALLLDLASFVSTWPDVPRWIWVAGALLSWLPIVRRHVSDNVRPWLPHRAAALALVVVAALSWWPPSRHEGWSAGGRARTPEVVGVDDGHGCVRDPTVSARSLAERFDPFGRPKSLAVQRTKEMSVADPAVRVWESSMRSGPRRRGVPKCVLPPSAEVARALAACRPYSSAPRARRLDEGPLQCWSSRLGAWRNAPVHLSAPPLTGANR